MHKLLGLVDVAATVRATIVRKGAHYMKRSSDNSREGQPEGLRQQVQAETAST